MHHEQLLLKAKYKDRLTTRLFEQAAIPPRFNNVSFDNYLAGKLEQQEVKNALIGFANDISNNLKSGRNVILLGNPGNGKTHLAIATAKAALNKGHTVLFTTAGNMIDKINEAGWNRASLIKNYAIPDLLILYQIHNIT